MKAVICHEQYRTGRAFGVPVKDLIKTKWLVIGRKAWEKAPRKKTSKEIALGKK